MSSPHAPSRPAGRVLILTRDDALFAGLGSALAALDLEPVRVHRQHELALRLVLPGPTPGPRGTDAGAAEPAAVLAVADAAALDAPDALGALAEAAAAADPPLPLACLAGPDDVRTRLIALRAGVADCVAERDPVCVAARLKALVWRDPADPPRILVVDDQPVAALFAARVLESAGMATERVCDSLAVLDAMQRFEPDLVLMDLHMPGASGIELTRLIRAQGPFVDVPVVFLSGEMDPTRQLEALRLGGDDFLAKPAAPQVLMDRVRSRLAEARRQAERFAGASAPDGATGLATRERLLDRLDRCLRGACQPAVSAPDGVACAPGAAPCAEAADSAGGPSQGSARSPETGLIYLELADDDVPLRVLADGVRAHLEPRDLAARVGERALAVLARRADRSALGALAAELAQAARKAVLAVQPELGPDAARGSARLPLRLGVGWCPLGADGEDAVTLVSRARKAARSSLSHGNGRVELYVGARPGPSSAVPRDAVAAAVKAGDFELLFQPVLRLDGAPEPRYEATPRLCTGDGELRAPAQFMPAVREAGLAAQVDRWVLKTALDRLAEARGRGRPAQLFVGQSLAALGEHGWVERLRRDIDGRDLIRLPPVLLLEARDLLADRELAARRAEALARLGVRLCLDRLGEDSDSEWLLERLSPAYVRLHEDAAAALPAHRLRALVARVHAQGGLVAAGGVDRPETVARLYAARVDLVQGPFVQPPTESMDFDFDSAADGG